MSEWTHVAGHIRVDALVFDESLIDDYRKVLESTIGKPVSYEELDTEKAENSRVPKGSEGSLCIKYNHNDLCDVAFWEISIWGDLRDYGDDDINSNLIPWFKDICKVLPIRGAILEAHTELGGNQYIVTPNNVITQIYEEDKK